MMDDDEDGPVDYPSSPTIGDLARSIPKKGDHTTVVYGGEVYDVENQGEVEL